MEEKGSYSTICCVNLRLSIDLWYDLTWVEVKALTPTPFQAMPYLQGTQLLGVLLSTHHSPSSLTLKLERERESWKVGVFSHWNERERERVEKLSFSPLELGLICLHKLIKRTEFLCVWPYYHFANFKNKHTTRIHSICLWVFPPTKNYKKI